MRIHCHTMSYSTHGIRMFVHPKRTYILTYMCTYLHIHPYGPVYYVLTYCVLLQPHIREQLLATITPLSSPLLSESSRHTVTFNMDHSLEHTYEHSYPPHLIFRE